MAHTLDEFSRIMTRLAADVQENASEGVRKVALVTDQALVLATPVDEGRARANWLVSVDAADGRQIPAYAQGAGGSTGAENARQALAQAQAAVRSFHAGRSRAIVITNNVPYIQKLDQGSSAQAPAGFVAAAVKVGREAVAGIRVVRRRS